jgi:hypothetical protein
VRSVRRTTAVAVSSIYAAALVTATAVAAPHNDGKAIRIVQRDWCDLGRYDQARGLGDLSSDARRNLLASARLVRAHRNGCALAEAAAGQRRERVRQNAPWLRHGREGLCPRDPLPLKRGDTHAGLRHAASELSRSDRAIVVRINDRERAGSVGNRCGARAQRRTIVITFSLTQYLPSASLSEYVVAVSHFRRYGWRAWLLLH